MDKFFRVRNNFVQTGILSVLHSAPLVNLLLRHAWGFNDSKQVKFIFGGRWYTEKKKIGYEKMLALQMDRDHKQLHSSPAVLNFNACKQRNKKNTN